MVQENGSTTFLQVQPPKGGQRLPLPRKEWVQLIRPPLEAPQRVVTGFNKCRGPFPLCSKYTRCLRCHGKWSEARQVKGLRTLNIIDEHRFVSPRPTSSYCHNFYATQRKRWAQICDVSVVLAWEQLQRFHKNRKANWAENPPQGQQLPN